MSGAAATAFPTLPISIVIPCFRCAATIGRAVESVAAQSRLPAEIILVDDASDDGTPAELRRLRQRFPPGWIRLIELTENGGAGSARNAGWDAAQSDYVAFLDADDAWHPKKLEIQYAVMLARPEAALSGHRSATDGRLPDLPLRSSPSAEPISFRQLLLANRFVTPSVILKRSLPLRFRTGRRHMEDHLLWMQVAARGHLLLRLDECLVTTFKPAYGAGGLSGSLWKMEKAECGNYLLLAAEGAISWPTALALCIYSGLKFLKRVAVVALRTLAGTGPA
jgi:teichuronic acid biosynthesis glycosyltransferase TuaG